MRKIPLVKNTISSEDLYALSEWILTMPRLTKGPLTDKFEAEWSASLGVKHSTFVSSGSSANLAAFYALKLSGKLKNNRVIVPAVSWVTTVAPAIQLGFEPVLCDCNLDNYGLDMDHLKELVEKHNPALLVTVNVLGFPNDYDQIREICAKNNIFLIEDSCESVGSTYGGRPTGTFGEISTFSFYYGHHMSTIEGGMICTEDPDLNTIIKSIRCHGWDRDLPPATQRQLRAAHNITDFKALYTFYYPGFNMRATDLQAFLGLRQLDRLSANVSARDRNFRVYQSQDFYDRKPMLDVKETISNFAYPIITSNIEDLVESLEKASIECRPLICGSIGQQPFWYKRYDNQKLPNAERVHAAGLYVPNNQDMEVTEVHEVVRILRGHFLKYGK